ncbi:LLM class flavin-dependent oxidoreductase [Streptomyces sp. NBC_01020]|uniref:LLM class flavin-dependent oxidoreductase n=1 Tax=unclassified Streptomyces TaxID=2593676 RepID=UPI00386AD82F|nr:LLM class flavin-dependent oxidoreductase [Streptomyces sp. NBC_01020]WSX70700.1 LLM class flavin-dependent oxidoreductase [Streptomyces sp. NBC_00932]
MPVPRPLHLAAEIGGRPRYDAGHYTRLALLAERGNLDFITLDDSFARPGPDALAVLARVAPGTGRIGLVPAVTTTHTEPFHVSSAVATLDWVSRGRAGWRTAVSDTAAEAALFGRRDAAPHDELWHEAGEVADVAARLWDSWDDDAEIRDVATGRFIDRDRLHYTDFTGRTFSVRGPAIVPRPPQGHPVTVVDGTGAAARETAVRHADVVLVRAEDPVTARRCREEIRNRAAAHGRSPDQLRVLVSLPVELHTGADAVGLARLIADWYEQDAADGFHLIPADVERDLPLIVDGTVPVLQHHCLLRRFYPGATLREHLGLARPAGRYAARSPGGRHAPSAAGRYAQNPGGRP